MTSKQDSEGKALAALWSSRIEKEEVLELKTAGMR
jgi:hypothetical protein